MIQTAPKSGHIERMKSVYGYLYKTKHYAIRFRIKEPNYQHLPEQKFDWSSTVSNKVTEELSKDAVKPLGKPEITTTFLDVNLWHGAITSRSITATLHFVNTTTTNWYSKRQATIENATYGSEFVATRTATEQIIELNLTLMYLGVPIKYKAFMFGHNKPVATSSMIPHSLLNKRHIMLSYHQVCEAIAAKIFAFYWCDLSQNKSDILSKHWDNSKVYHIIKELFDYQGPITLIKKE